MLKYNENIQKDERVLQKQKVAQIPAIVKIQNVSYQEIPAYVKLYIVLEIKKWNREIIFTAMKINTYFEFFHKYN